MLESVDVGKRPVADYEATAELELYADLLGATAGHGARSYGVAGEDNLAEVKRT